MREWGLIIDNNEENGYGGELNTDDISCDKERFYVENE